MNIYWRLATALFTLLFLPAIGGAETLYVSDQLIITFRQGKSSQHKILKTLKTGTPLEILESAEGDEYVKVRLQSGEEGYVLKQYLTEETPKPIIISRLEQQIAKLRQQLAQAETKLTESSRTLQEDRQQLAATESDLKGKIAELGRNLAKTQAELQNATDKYNTLLDNSGKVVEITNERERLQKATEQLNSEVRALTAENEELLRTGMIKWFLAGGGVLFFGWMIGRASRKKRSMY